MNEITLNGTTYKRDFLESQILSIEASKTIFNSLRDAEIQECVDILKQMGKKPVEEVKAVEETEPIEEVIKPLTLRL